MQPQRVKQYVSNEVPTISESYSYYDQTGVSLDLEAEPILSQFTHHQNAKLFVDGSKINESHKNLMTTDVCECKNRIWHGTLLCQLPKKMWCISNFHNV